MQHASDSECSLSQVHEDFDIEETERDSKFLQKFELYGQLANQCDSHTSIQNTAPEVHQRYTHMHVRQQEF